MYSGKPITAEKVMNYVLGKIAQKVKVVDEFKKHNEEMQALLAKGYAKGILDKFTITLHHLQAFLNCKFNTSNVEFSDLNLEFVKYFEFYLRTVRKVLSHLPYKNRKKSKI
ncbi:phage integrase SAM-like domain-containing protein [Flavobacterium sp.]|uniref:phage integrase SAM-like domain-containing protein n=1 Tax=Flavobacterium sp. TaxID=239 RepID=UPI0032635003